MSVTIPRETLACEGLTWDAPDGRRVLDGLSFALGPERTGLVGANGSGKTTLARLLVGDLVPTAGLVRRSGVVAWLPQGVEARVGESVAGALGIEQVLDALEVIEAGGCDDRLFERVGDRWDIAERAAILLDRLAVPGLDPRTPMERLSGGEAMRVALAGCLLREPDLLVLDEPTNHLDRRARRALDGVLGSHRGGLLVISHDRGLLRRMERILELSPLGLRSYGGGFEAYRGQVVAEQEAARRSLDAAEQRLGRQRRAAQEAVERQARRAAGGKRQALRCGLSKIEIKGRKRQAERTSGRLGNLHQDRVAEARRRLEEARSAVLEQASVRMELGATTLPSGKIVLEAEGVNMRWPGGRWLWPEPGHDVRLVGPSRLSIEGPSGSGKSTLARILIGELEPSRGSVRLGEERVAWLDQRCRLLPAGVPLLDGMLQSNAELDAQQARWALDRFQLGRGTADRPPETLSGGERMRAALAGLFGGPRPPRLLVLDEPTNNLDLDTVSVLEQALAAYRGALVVISHDADFVAAVGVDQRLELEQGMKL